MYNVKYTIRPDEYLLYGECQILYSPRWVMSNLCVDNVRYTTIPDEYLVYGGCQIHNSPG
jgi:hypothetical protein